jgi:single-strand DNA-binding protein
MLNKIVIMGRLAKDPELRYTQSQTPVASFTVAVDRDFKNQDGSRSTDFIDCVAWRQGGEFVSKYFHKGSMIVLEGSLQSRQWQDRDGNKRTSWEINVEHAYFGESKREDRGESYGTQRPTESRSYGNPNVSAGGVEDLGPGAGVGNPFTQTQQQSMEDDWEGALPF